MTVNGVAFTAESGNTSNFVTNPCTPYVGACSGTGLDANYANMLNGLIYNVTGGTLENLIAGHDYAVQIWCNDSRNAWPGNS